MFLLKIAFRNLFRRKKRTFIMAGVLALAILFALVMDSFMGGLMDVSFSNVIDFESAHMVVGTREFFAEDDRPLQKIFRPGEGLEDEIRKSAGFVAMTQVVDFRANIIAGREEFPVSVKAIDPAAFSQVFRFEDYTVSGEFLRDGEPGIIIGSDLSNVLEVKPGDYYTLLFRDRSGSFNTMQGEIRGIFSTPNPQANMMSIFVDREYAASSLGIEKNEISQLMVRMEDRAGAVLSADILNDRISVQGLEARSWRDASDMLLSMEVWGEIEIMFIMALIMLVGAIGIINVVVLSALERVEEIGMMKAMGLKEGEIVRVFVLEAGGVGIIGALAGSGFAALIIALLSTIGLDLQVIYGDAIVAMGIPVLGRIYGTWNLQAFIMFSGFGLLVSLAASILPSYWAARKDPVEAIYHR